MKNNNIVGTFELQKSFHACAVVGVLLDQCKGDSLSRYPSDLQGTYTYKER